MKLFRLKANTAVFLLFVLLGFTACEQETVGTEIVGIYPAANAEVAPGGITFKWISNGFGNYRFRLGNADMSTILVDTTLAENSLYVNLLLTRAATYHWEVQQGTALLARNFIAADQATLSLVSPTDGTVIQLSGTTFTWASNAQGPFRFRLGDSTLSTVVVDQNVYALSVTPSITLTPNTTYRWEVRVEDKAVSALVRTASASLITLLTPAQGATVLPCCGQQFTWQSLLQAPFEFRLGSAAGLLDTTIQGTSWMYVNSFAPGMPYYWEVQKGGEVERRDLSVTPLEVMFPAAINGTWYINHYDPINGSSTQTHAGVITISNVSAGNYAKVGNGNPINFEFTNTSLVRYAVGDSANYEELEVYYGNNQVIYEWRNTVGTTVDRGRFVSQ